MKRRFEEILEECLSAQSEGRRSVEESLSLYPSLAPELGPLLRTASNVSYAFEGLNPPAYLLERGRLRLIAASSERRLAREIARGVWGFGRARMPWGIRHWGLLSSGVAAACAIVIAGTIVLIGGGEGGNDAVEGPTPAPTSASARQFAANLEDLVDRLNDVKSKARQGAVTSEDIRALQRATEALADSGLPPDDASRQAAEQALSDQYVTAIELSETAPDQAGEFQELASLTKDAADTLDLDIFPPSPTPVTEPTPTEAPVDTATPTEAPTPTAPATETPAPTEAPTPTPTPPLQGVE